MKRVFLIFAVAFLLNLAWENAHAALYDNYMGGEITEFILARAAVADATFISFLTAPFLIWSKLKRQEWLIVAMGLVVAIGLEWWALETGRWAYNEHMPIVPYLQVGLTPTIQLGLLGYVSFKAQKKLLVSGKTDR